MIVESFEGLPYCSCQAKVCQSTFFTLSKSLGQKVSIIFLPLLTNFAYHCLVYLEFANLETLREFVLLPFKKKVLAIEIPFYSHLSLHKVTYWSISEYASVGYMAKRIQMRKNRFLAIQKMAEQKKNEALHASNANINNESNNIDLGPKQTVSTKPDIKYVFCHSAFLFLWNQYFWHKWGL